MKTEYKSNPGLDPAQEKKKSCCQKHFWNKRVI